MNHFTRFLSDRPTRDRQIKHSQMLVVIDSGVTDASGLISQVEPNAEVLLLDPNLDGVEQITAALESSPAINSLHIVSHGEPGRLFLGQTQLSLKTLSQYQEHLKTWSKHLQGNSLVLYGCQVAFGVGRNFLQTLHRLTGANITASEQRVGNPNLGGNWNLNVRIGEFVGSVEEKLAFLPSVSETYAGVFVPTVGLTASPDTISEADGSVLNLTFNTEGEIPPEGVTVRLQGDTPGILQEFTAAQTRFDQNGEVFYRFDKGLVENGVTGGNLDLFALEDDLSSFTFTITEPTATIAIPVLNDILEEPDQVFGYTLEAGTGYTVDPDGDTASFTVTDGVPGGVGPTVSVSGSPTTLIEPEQTAFTITFTLDEPPPAEGVLVYLNGDVPRAVAEFDINASNPRNPENDFTVTGPIVTGGSIAGTNETASALLFRVTEQTATLTVPVFDDGPNEGTETFNYTLLDGEQYEVNPDASDFTVEIKDLVTLISGTNEDDNLAGDDWDNVIRAFAGDDLVTAGVGDDTVFGGNGDDLLVGDAGNDEIFGDRGDDTIIGGSGNDEIFGDRGDDLLVGDAGNDEIFGDRGDDTIIGGSGNDTLTGGKGSTLFVFGSGDGTDTITDFDPEEDTIGLVEGELTFEEIAIADSDMGATISVIESGETLAVLQDVHADELTEELFMVTPDVTFG